MTHEFSSFLSIFFDLLISTRTGRTCVLKIFFLFRFSCFFSFDMQSLPNGVLSPNFSRASLLRGGGGPHFPLSGPVSNLHQTESAYITDRIQRYLHTYQATRRSPGSPLRKRDTVQRTIESMNIHPYLLFFSPVNPPSPLRIRSKNSFSTYPPPESSGLYPNFFSAYALTATIYPILPHHALRG